METETKPAQKSGSFSLKELENHVDEGRNKLLISCIRCPSKILNAGVAEYKDIEVRKYSGLAHFCSIC